MAAFYQLYDIFFLLRDICCFMIYTFVFGLNGRYHGAIMQPGFRFSSKDFVLFLITRTSRMRARKQRCVGVPCCWLKLIRMIIRTRNVRYEKLPELWAELPPARCSGDEKATMCIYGY